MSTIGDISTAKAKIIFGKMIFRLILFYTTKIIKNLLYKNISKNILKKLFLFSVFWLISPQAEIVCTSLGHLYFNTTINSILKYYFFSKYHDEGISAKIYSFLLIDSL